MRDERERRDVDRLDSPPLFRPSRSSRMSRLSRTSRPPRVAMLRLAGVKNPVLYFVSPSSGLIACTGLDRRMIGTLHG